ncbi:universal stress protein [Kibdelosporangium philippinense]|uniref:Universal stress protein n=1 Tax=Kibdelosporangium philippinense TaxID=211113 RepID=A0ABS8Z5N2_9PSEU|nr:universal stress protein [Kibdelosporangium philippinense]MCE7002080.1 universal stress protein [Kibdelosporangium philippinense]
MSKPIVVGVNGQPNSDIALEWAIAEAAHRAVPLLILHAGEVAPMRAVGRGPLLQTTRTSGKALVDKAIAVVQAMNKDIFVSSVIAPGAPADVLIRWSAEALMLVVGNRGRSPLRSSVGAKVAARARCPVIIARAVPSKHTPVVLGVDGSLVSKAAAAFAFDYAAKHTAGVRAIHTWRRSSLPGSGALPAQRRAHLYVAAEALADAHDRHPTVLAWVVCTIGNARDVLRDESTQAQLLVVGTHGRGAKSGLLLGSVSRALIRTASCPVAVIPTKCPYATGL